MLVVLLVVDVPLVMTPVSLPALNVNLVLLVSTTHLFNTVIDLPHTTFRRGILQKLPALEKFEQNNVDEVCTPTQSRSS
jgi:hypothetical protein